MSPRRELAAAVVACLVGGALLVAAAGRPWFVVHLHGPVPRTQGVPGRDVTALPYAVGWLGLAGVVAVLAVRRRGRAVIGAVLVAGGLAAAAVGGWRATSWSGELGWSGYGPVTSVSTGRTPWPWVVVAAAVLLAAAGGWVALRGGRWPGMGARYDAPRPPRPRDPQTSAWDALDRGDDPTA